MGRSGILMLVAAMVIVGAASAGGWMALNGGGSPEPAAAGTKKVMGELSIGPGGSDIPEPRGVGVSVPPGRPANMKPSPATIESDSSGDSLVADYGWAISLAIAASLAAVPIAGIYELRDLWLPRE